MGELNELMDDGTYESLMDHVTSINVACGGHAGDDALALRDGHVVDHSVRYMLPGGLGH